MNNSSEPTSATTQTLEEFEDALKDFQERFQGMVSEIQQAIVGYNDLISDVLVSIFSQGHVLLEGVPGLGKTYLVKVLSKVLGLTFGRIQCTPDLMPADVLGTHIVGEDDNGHRVFRFEKGPVFHHLLLVDEINRATPKTQSAMLEVMQERTVTAGGDHFKLPLPFFVLATQNPLEMEGTYPLPEAQLDRFFFKLHVPFPTVDDLVRISDRTTAFTEPQLTVVMSGVDLIAFQELLTHVAVSEPISRYAASIILATHPEQPNTPPDVGRYISYGASPRGMQTLIRAARAYCVLDGRVSVSLNDVRRAAKPALRHRIILNFEGEAEQINVDALIDRILQTVPTPAHGAL